MRTNKVNLKRERFQNQLIPNVESCKVLKYYKLDNVRGYFLPFCETTTYICYRYFKYQLYFFNFKIIS